MKTKITNIATLCTWSPKENTLLNKKNVEILIEDSSIIQIDSTVGDAEVEIDADGALITPGFVDSHTEQWTSNRIFLDSFIKQTNGPTPPASSGCPQSQSSSDCNSITSCLGTIGSIEGILLLCMGFLSPP